MGASSRSLKGLDWSNLFMADVKDGVGVYLSVYLLTVRHWQPDQIGYVIAVPGLVGILIQPLAGALIDKTTYKRFLLMLASGVIALCCLVIILMEGFYPTFISQAVVGLVQSVYTPGVAAITLGMVGQAALSKRIGRNETFNHVGNMAAAIIAGLMGRFISYEAIFYFSIFQCFALIVAVLFIKEQDIDHNLARAASATESTDNKATGLKQLFSSRKIIVFIIAMGLFHLANAALLPLVGQKMGLVDQKNSSLYLSAAIIIAQGVMAFVASYSGKAADKGRKAVMIIAFILLPVRALLFAFIDNPYLLTAAQILDGVGAGIFGVISIIMIADLSEGSGRFNLLQGVVYSAIGLACSISSILSGIIVKNFGYAVGFVALAAVAVLGALFFQFVVPETKGINAGEAPDQAVKNA
ncbi:MFS transporter [Mucilaginibacter sp. Bleaf8]|uniref:MFS transporter n=1 Tax=Mucilaginibacter sp. Bleaf8 TaxID=2834430 RepID=UPI001BCD0042|nr:MFS transporter [Mucilaginibacter sp. Bleaf8]MBS7564241.1 MFS transporter [Mucilaginibacter sp. Bleaf8]